MMIFDSHAHYDDEQFDEDRDILLKRMHDEDQIAYIVNPGVDISRSEKAVSLAERYDFMYAAVGFHPHEVAEIQETDLKRIEALAKHAKVVAIGEIGLDYYYDFAPKEAQKKWFISQIELAKSIQKPIIVHDRDAHGDVMDILKQTGAEEVGGVLHCFAGSVEMAKECVKKGFYLGIGGVVTFKNARKLVEVVEAIPLEWLIIETDAPYLTPVPHRGKRNESSYLSFIIEKIAEIKHISPEEVTRVTTENAKQLFQIGKF